MHNLSEKVADSYRQGKKVKSNPSNPVTSRRRKLYSVIKERTGGNAQAELDYAISIINQERPKIENYILSKNEVPMDKIEDLIMQAYQLRSQEIDHTASLLGVSDGEAAIFLEDDEASSETANDNEVDNFIGELFAPIGLAAKHLHGNSGGLSTPNNFVDAGLIGGLINTVGSKVNNADLRRAAQDKPAGILGFLGAGGTAGYNALRNYFKVPANADEKARVIAGQITDVSQLRGYGGAVAATSGTNILPGGINVAGVDVIKAIETQKKQEAIKKALPFIIIGLVVIIVVTILIVRNAKHK